MESEPVVVLGIGQGAGRWAEALTNAGHPAVVADPFTFVPPSSFVPSPIRLAVVDSSLEAAPSLLVALRAANVPVILATAPTTPLPAEADPLTEWGSWQADAYVGTGEELVGAVPVVLDPQARQDGPAMHLTFRGSMPPQAVGFPIGTAFPLRDGAATFIGRSRSIQVHLPSPHVGRAHAMVAVLPGSDRRAVAVDLRSNNGTFMKGKRCPMEILAPGDEIAIAGYRFAIESLPSYSA